MPEFGDKDKTLVQVIASVPTAFDLQPFGARWFHEIDIASCL